MNGQEKCDICNTVVQEHEGYQLTTTQVVRSPQFWRDHCERHQEEYAAMGVPSYDALLRSPARTEVAEQIARNATPWLVCKRCIHLFDLDREQARIYAWQWWESGRTFAPPGTGPAPLSEIRMVEEKVAAPPEAEEAPETDEIIPAPAPKVKEALRPPRGVPRWPPVVALLNLTGLGLGYLCMKRWLRWLIHLLLTAGLITAAYLTNAACFPELWMVVVGVWLLWMACDGWLQARRLVRAVPTGAVGRRWLLVAVAVLLLVLVTAGLWGYVALGQQEFAAGMAAYWEADCRAAMRHFNHVTTLYELTLSPNVAAADARIVECSLLVFAENARGQGEYADAVAGYEAYLHRYPESVLIIFARDTVAETYGEWATRLRQAEDYQAAIEQYQVILSDYPETPTGGQAAALTAGTYAAWAAQLREEGKYGEAIEKHLIILGEYPDTPAGEEAAVLAAETYAEWAAHLRKDGKYEEAIEKYLIVLNEYPDTPAQEQVNAAAAETYAEWAMELHRAGKYEEALEQYRAILTVLPHPPATVEAEIGAAEVLAEWAAQLREAGDYTTAIQKYQAILDEFPNTPPGKQAAALAAETCSEWATQLRERHSYSQAIQKYEAILSQYSDTPSGAQADTLMAETYWEWASCLQQGENLKEAIQKYQIVLDQFPTASVATEAWQVVTDLYAQATQAQEAGNYCQALSLLEGFAQPGVSFSEEAEASMPQTLYNCGVEKHGTGAHTQAATLYNRVTREYPDSPQAEEAQTALEAVQVDIRRSSFAGTLKEIAPTTPGGYAPAGVVIVEIANDTQESIEVLFSAKGPNSRSVTVEACPTCEPYTSEPRRCRSAAPVATVRLTPGEYDVLVLCADCPSPLTSEALHSVWTLQSGRLYGVFYYIVEESLFPPLQITIPPLPLVIPTLPPRQMAPATPTPTPTQP